MHSKSIFINKDNITITFLCGKKSFYVSTVPIIKEIYFFFFRSAMSISCKNYNEALIKKNFLLISHKNMVIFFFQL